MTNNVQQRVDDLEIKLSFLDDTVESLNQVIAKQDHTILILQQQMAWLYERYKEINPEEGIDAFDAVSNIPPHY